MSNISSYEVAAADNNAPPPDGAPEGWFAPEVNDTLREFIARVRRWWADTDGSLLTTGTGNNYTLTSTSSYVNLEDINILVFRADRANTGPAALNVDGLGNIDIRKGLNTALIENDILANQIVSVTYNANQGVFQLLSLVGALLRSNLTQGEIDQIANIDDTTISATQWGYLGGLDQSVASDAIPSFDAVHLGFHQFGDITASGSLYRTAAGLYETTSATPALQWSSRNFTAGDGLTVSYGSADEPTLAVDSTVWRDSDVGTDSNQTPTNANLGSAAYEAVSAFLASSALTTSISQFSPDSDEVVSEEGIVNWGKVLGWGLRQSDFYNATDVAAKNLLSGVYRASGGASGDFPGNGVLLHLRGANTTSNGGEQFGLWFRRNTNEVYARGYDNGADAHLPPIRLLTEDDIGTGFDQSLSENGWCELPNGLIFQWGRESGGSGIQTVSFPITFPNACRNVVAAPAASDAHENNSATIQTSSFTTSSFQIGLNRVGVGYWQAIGY